MGTGTYNLRAGHWKKVASYYGTRQKNVHIQVGTDEQCRWRRKTVWLTTGSGKFFRTKIVILFNSWVEVKSPVNTTCTTSFEGP